MTNLVALAVCEVVMVKPSKPSWGLTGLVKECEMGGGARTDVDGEMMKPLLCESPLVRTTLLVFICHV